MSEETQRELRLFVFNARGRGYPLAEMSFYVAFALIISGCRHIMICVYPLAVAVFN